MFLYYCLKWCIGGGIMFKFFRRVAVKSGVVMILSTLFAISVMGAPTKVSTNTVAAKVAPTTQKVVTKVAQKPAATAQKAAAKPVEKAAATKAPAKTAAKPVAKAVSAPAKVVKKESVVEKFAPQLKPKDKKPQKKKVVKMRKQVIDGKVCVWGSSPENAELAASDAIRKFVGKKTDFQFKDCVITADGAKYFCLLRFNYSDQIPETLFFETEMVTGFGKNKLRAFSNAVSKARSRVKSVRSAADWNSSNSTIKDSSEMGFIPYDVVFATAGGQTYCKVFFRYLKTR